MPLSLILIIMYCLGLSRRGIRAACAARLPFLPMATFPALIKTSTREKPCQRSTGKKSDSCSALPNTLSLFGIYFIFVSLSVFDISDCAFRVVQTATCVSYQEEKEDKEAKATGERWERPLQRPKAAKARPARRQRLAARAR